MAKNIKTQIKIQLPGGGATPAPPVGTALGPHGVSTMDFCKEFNAATSDKRGQTVPVVITVYTDRSFSFIMKTPPVSELIRKAIKVSKGASNPGKDVVGTIKWGQVEEIAKIKMPDLNAIDIEAAKKIVAGSARSMGINVVD